MDCSSPPMAPPPRKERSNARLVDQTSWTRTWPELLEPRPATNYNTKNCGGQAQAGRKSSDILFSILPYRWDDGTVPKVRCVPRVSHAKPLVDDATLRNGTMGQYETKTLHLYVSMPSVLPSTCFQLVLPNELSYCPKRIKPQLDTPVLWDSTYCPTTVPYRPKERGPADASPQKVPMFECGYTHGNSRKRPRVPSMYSRLSPWGYPSLFRTSPTLLAGAFLSDSCSAMNWPTVAFLR